MQRLRPACPQIAETPCAPCRAAGISCHRSGATWLPQANAQTLTSSLLRLAGKHATQHAKSAAPPTARATATAPLCRTPSRPRGAARRSLLAGEFTALVPPQKMIGIVHPDEMVQRR